MKFAEWVFWIAGIYGLIVLVPGYFLESWISQKMPPPITHPEYFYGFLGVAIAWQLLFLIMAYDPLRYRPVMLCALVEKFSFGFAIVTLYLQRRISSQLLAGGIGDLFLGVLFFAAFCFTAKDQIQSTKR